MQKVVSRRAYAVVLAGALALPMGAVTATSAVAASGYDRTSPAEARRVDQVKVTLDWFDCSPLTPDGSPADCATAVLPLDYDRPGGAKTQVAVLRVKAQDQKNKIGTLFVNPGGPGGSGTSIASMASLFLPPEVLERFDVIGFDPRGTNLSDNVKCWANLGEQAKALKPIASLPFPFTQTETQAYVQAAKDFGTACSTTGKPLSGAMSTAEVARDMDVLRRTVGDAKLTYLGFSYGTYLGNVYANLFPDRVRAMVIDGNLDPVAWAGTAATKGTPQTARLRSDTGSYKALRELLTRCGKAGPSYCSFAAKGDPLTNYAAIVADLKKKPITISGDFGDQVLDYPTLISWLLGDLYSPTAGQLVDTDLTTVWDAIHGDPTLVAAATRSVAARIAAVKAAKAAKDTFRQKAKALNPASALAVNWPYDNSPEAFQSVLCTDGLNPADAAQWPGYAATDDQQAPGFGPFWTWASAPCAANTWTVKDSDAYAGPFTRRTANPVLVVGNYWDPATSYQSSVTVSRLLPGSRLLSNDSWGHTAFGTSDCDTAATSAYLLTLALPAEGTVCTGADQPYTVPLATPTPSPTPSPTATATTTPTPTPTAIPTRRAAKAVGGRKLPPIQPMLPGIVPMR